MFPRYSSRAVSALAVIATSGTASTLATFDTTTRVPQDTDLPALFVKVNLYVVVFAGFTALLPERAVEPIEGDITTFAAFSLDHLSVTAGPGRIAVLFEESEHGGVGVPSRAPGTSV